MQTSAFNDSSSGSSRTFVECDGELFAQRFGITRQRGERGVGVGVGFESRQRALAESRSLFDIGEAQALGKPFGLQQLDGLPTFGRRFIASGLEPQCQVALDPTPRGDGGTCRGQSRSTGVGWGVLRVS